MTHDDDERELEAAPEGEDRELRPSYTGALGFLGGLVLGALIGAGVALLVAPERGEATRRRLRRQWRKARHQARRGIRDMKHELGREAQRRRRWLERSRREEEEEV